MSTVTIDDKLVDGCDGSGGLLIALVEELGELFERCITLE